MLDEKQQREFAMKSFSLRFPEYVNDFGEIDYEEIAVNTDIQELLKPIRKEDKGNSIWQVYNTVQEKLIKGEFTHIGVTNKERSGRPLTNIRRNLIVNKGLWELAEEYSLN